MHLSNLQNHVYLFQMIGDLNDIANQSNFLPYSIQFILFEQNILYEKMIISFTLHSLFIHSKPVCCEASP